MVSVTAVWSRLFCLTIAERTTTACAINLETPPHFACLSRAEQCPVCSGDNQCRLAKGHLYKGPCWCEEITVPSRVAWRFRVLMVCIRCACAGPVLRRLRGSRRETSNAATGEEDFYLDENGNVVFTAAYHLRRGTCCGNGCRHCPF